MIIQRKTDTENLRRLLKQFPITLLTGPRRCGKTTLARSLNPDHFFTLESPSSREHFTGLCKDEKSCRGLIVLDEIQTSPETLPLLRQLVDRGADVRFLILGSALLATRAEISRNLMGRMAKYELGGFTLQDVGAGELEKHWFRGGMPESFLAPDDATSTTWKREYLASFPYSSMLLESSGSSSHVLNRLMTVLPAYSGSLISFSNIARSLEVSLQTTKRYVDILTATGFTRLLEPFESSRGRALGKMPKLYVRDTGLLAFLLGIERQEGISHHKMTPMLWETYAIETLASFVRSTFREELRFWRNRSGIELDAVWLHQGMLVGVEVQAREEPKVTSNMRRALGSLNLSHICVLHRGSALRELAEHIIGIPITRLDAMLPDFRRSHPSKPQEAAPASEHPMKKQVFVSYSHEDDSFVKQLVKALDAAHVNVTVDFKSLRLGDRIDEFIRKAVRKTEWTILVVSQSSLRSPWVMAEFLETILHEHFQDQQRLLPLTLDKSVFELELALNLDKELEVKIGEVNGLIRKALDRHMDIDRLVGVRRRLLDLRNNIGKALDRLTSVLIGDFSNPNEFTENLGRVIQALGG